MIRLITLLCLFFTLQLSAQTTVVDSFTYEGVWRNYRIFLPTGFNSSVQRPLVFNLHGYTSNAIQQELYSGFNSVADTANVVVCYPNGINNAWNIVGGFPNDIGFIDTLITVINNQFNINLNRVYSTGLSNGGFLSNLLGCSLANRIAAIAPVAGTNVPLIQNSCSPSRQVPVLYIHGDADAVVNYNGSTGYVSAADLMTLWSSVDGCTSVTDTFLLPDISLTDFCRAEKITWHDCDGSVRVIHYKILGGGHTWPGSSLIIGTTNQDFNASGVIWDFFYQHELPTGSKEISSLANLKVLPNPFLSEFQIQLPYPIESIVNIYSFEGKLIHRSKHSGEQLRISADILNPGIYQLIVEYGNRKESIRIIKF